MSPRKGFDADGGAFTLSCFALLYRCCCVRVRGVVCWALGPVGGWWVLLATGGQWGLELEMGAWCWPLGGGPFSLGRVFQTPAVGDYPSSPRA